MSPRTSSLPPSSYGSYDDTDCKDYHPGHSAFGQSSYQSYSVSQTSSNAAAKTTNTRSNTRRGNSSSKGFIPTLRLPLNIPRRILSSTVVQVTSLTVIYLFCITTVCFIFCTSYVLTFYDDTRRVIRTSRAWARVKNGVRDRISMLGDDWEEFLQKYFDNDVNKSGHLGGKAK